MGTSIREPVTFRITFGAAFLLPKNRHQVATREDLFCGDLAECCRPPRVARVLSRSARWIDVLFSPSYFLSD
jgi:hypothetical protein